LASRLWTLFLGGMLFGENERSHDDSNGNDE